MKLNEMQIAALEEKGFRRWTKGTMDRLYINAETLGLDVERYKTGNVCSAYYRGERISHNRGSAMVNAKTYIDIATGELISDNWTLEQDARHLYEETMEALEIAEAEVAEEAEAAETNPEQGNPFSAMTAPELDRAEAEMKQILEASASGYNARITPEVRESAVETLHQIRLARWALGVDVPTEDDRDEYEHMRDRLNRKLERISDVAERYMVLNSVRKYQDSLDYLAK